MSELTIKLLDGFQVTYGEQTLPKFRDDKIRALLAYLAIYPDQPHRREYLATLLWSELNESSSRAALRKALFRLRGALDKLANGLSDRLLQVSRHSIQFAEVWVDVRALVLGLESNDDVAALKSSVAYYQQPLLQGFSLRDASLFDEWLDRERERIEQSVVIALAQLTNHYLSQNKLGEAKATAQRQIALQPYQELGHRQLMLALAQAHDVAGALAHYEKCKTLFEQELGAPPSAETQRLYQRLSAQQPVQRRLPTMLTPFFGRLSESQHLCDLLQNPANHLVTLIGPGGMGKTRLALHVGEQVGGAFADGVCFVPLAGVKSERTDGVLKAIVAALNLQLYGGEATATQLHNYLQSRELLLILDNFEHVIEQADVVLHILQAAPRVTILCTSRERLGFAAELPYQLQGLRIPTGTEADPAAFDCVRLFIERAERARFAFTLNEENLAHVIALCNFVGGSPLGIELTTAALRLYSLSALVERLHEAHEWLATRQRDVPARHRSMRVVFEESWRLLTRREQRTLAQLSVFRGTFSAEAACTITTATRGLLVDLMEKSLLEQDDKRRFALHELVREFAAEKLTDLDHIQREYARYFLTEFAQQGAALQQQAPHNAQLAIERDLKNIRQAWQWGVAQQTIPQLIALVTSLHTYYEIAGLYDEALTMLATVETTAPSDSALHVQLQIAKAHFTHLTGATEAATTLLKATMPHTEGALRAEVCLALANICIDMRWIDEADSIVQDSMAISDTLDIPDLKARATHTQASLAFRALRFEDSLTYAKSTLAQWRKLGNKLRTSSILYLLGDAYRELVELDSARDCLQQALHGFQEINDQRQVGNTLGLLGLIEYFYGSVDEAERYWTDAGVAYETSGTRRDVLRVQARLSACMQARGMWDQALPRRRRIVEEFESLGDTDGVSVNCINVASNYGHFGMWEQAERYLTRSEQIERGSGKIVNVYSIQARHANQQGDYARAKDVATRAIEIAIAHKTEAIRQAILCYLGDAQLSLGELAEAEASYREALRLMQKGNNSGDWVMAYEGLALTALARKEFVEARHYVKQIERYMEKDSPFAGRYYYAIYRVAHGAGEANAGAYLQKSAEAIQRQAQRIQDLAFRQRYLNMPNNQQVLTTHRMR